MQHLTDRELLQRAWSERDPLTTTELETQLANRFEALLDELEGDHPVLALFEDAGIEHQTVEGVEQIKTALQLITDWPQAKSLLDVLNDFDLDNDEMLRERLVRLRKFDDVMQDLAEPLQSLTTLATTE